MINKKQLNSLIKIFKTYPSVKLVYIFGSRARGQEGPLSDYDFGIFLDGLNEREMFKIKLDLQYKISKLLVTDKVDIVVLNTTVSPEIKYNIVAKGKLVYSIEPFKMLVEPMILNEYFDFRDILLRYKLTKARA